MVDSVEKVLPTRCHLRWANSDALRFVGGEVIPSNDSVDPNGLVAMGNGRWRTPVISSFASSSPFISQWVIKSMQLRLADGSFAAPVEHLRTTIRLVDGEQDRFIFDWKLALRFWIFLCSKISGLVRLNVQTRAFQVSTSGGNASASSFGCTHFNVIALSK